MRQFDVCSGVGAGFGIAGLRAGWELIGVCEIEQYCADILNKRFPGVHNYGDVRGLPVRDIKKQRIEVLTASPPCQPFSINGKRLGAADERDCFPAVLDAIANINPKFFCIENVTGLLTCPHYPGQQSGSYFRNVVKTIDSFGYDAEWICVCSGQFAAPFLRERLLLVGISRRIKLNWERTTPWPNQVRNTIEKAGVIAKRRSAKPGYPQQVVRYPAKLVRPLGIPSGNSTVRKQRQAAGNLLDPRVGAIAVSRVQYLATLTG
ncbi:DNA cytosine methyltransferase [Trichormus variabilis]|uniref:DNA cytosine methyltransferase n=1 Tax=Anabaena variabilis TaxID=264691 RepID=UPI000F8E0DE1|nr:DNA cytosine methyltransferase [Trichormus variabilis FACHB-164]